MYALRLPACALSMLLLALTPQPAASAAPQQAPQTVLELFTSQGCSSCPPADLLMGEFVKQPHLIALTFAVDYWDYLGWKDTLAQPAHSRRQKAYAINRADRNVYTPQMVVNGISHAVGSRKNQITSQIKSTSKQLSPIHVPMSVEETEDKMIVTIGEAPAALKNKEATLWLILYQSSVKVRIARGENRGRKITYHNVVRAMTPAGMWNGKVKTIDLPKSGLMQPGYDGFALLLQQETGGAILGATSRDLPVSKNREM